MARPDNQSSPIKISYSLISELIIKLQPYLERPVKIQENEQFDSLIKYFLSLFNELDHARRESFLQTECLWLQDPSALESCLKHQAVIESANNFNYIETKDNFRIEGANKSGGLSLLDQTIVSKIRSVGTEILKQLGKKILSGKFNLTQVSFPIRCMQANTALHNTLNTFKMIPLYINKAVNTFDHVERMKLVIVSILSSFLYTSTFEKPLNPILGETLTGVLEDGTKLFAEQTSHHPPVSSFFVDGNGFKIFGYFNYTAKAGLNSITVTNLGKRIFQFFDGYSVTLTCPEEVFSGTFLGTMRHESLGTIQASDNEGNTCTVTIGKIKGKPSDYLQGIIFDRDKRPIANLQGTYLGYLDFDGVRYWDARFLRPFEINYLRVLESDAENRKDILVLRSGNVDFAQAAKEELENIQRNDRKLRTKFAR